MRVRTHIVRKIEALVARLQMHAATSTVHIVTVLFTVLRLDLIISYYCFLLLLLRVRALLQATVECETMCLLSAPYLSFLPAHNRFLVSLPRYFVLIKCIKGLCKMHNVNLFRKYVPVMKKTPVIVTNKICLIESQDK